MAWQNEFEAGDDEEIACVLHLLPPHYAQSTCMLTASSTCELMKIWPQILDPSTQWIASSRYANTTRRSKTRWYSTTRNTPGQHPGRGDLAAISANGLLQVEIRPRSRQKWPVQYLSAPAERRVTWVQPTWSYVKLPLLVREDLETLGTWSKKRRLLSMVDYYNVYGEAVGTEVIPETVSSKFPTYNEHSFEETRVKLLGELDQIGQQSLIEFTQELGTVHQQYMEAKESNNIAVADISCDRLLGLYQSLPLNRMLYIDANARLRLLEVMSGTAKKNYIMTLKFLSLLDDIDRANIKIPKIMYNTGIHLAGRTLGKVTSKEVQGALLRWTSIEELARVRSDTTTFNILFDVAVKGEQFALAEMIMDEMITRKLRLDRFSRVNLIYYHGIRGDGEAIRKTYRDLVQKDLIIDRPVLNAVIAALFRAGEAEAADQVFRRMKDFAETNWTDPNLRLPLIASRAVKRVIKNRDSRDERLVQRLQQEQDIGPDVKTFSIMINHQVNFTGNFDKIATHLEEMQTLNLVPSGRIFMDLFRGFHNRGGKRFTFWSPSMLERVWDAFVQLVNDESTEVYWDRWSVIWALRAYTTCIGRTAALQKWDIVKMHWKKASEHEEFMLGIIAEAERQRGRRPSQH